MKALSEKEIENKIKRQIKDWVFDENSLKKEFKFKSFGEAFSFMTAVAMQAEKMDHHPDWSNSYNKVNISLSTHSSDGVTQNDFDLAEKIDSIFMNFLH